MNVVVGDVVEDVDIEDVEEDIEEAMVRILDRYYCTAYYN